MDEKARGGSELDTGAHDFAMDGTAQVHRQLKVNALRTWCWDQFVYSHELRVWISTHPELLRRICRDVGVNPPSAGSPTWSMVIADLETKERWAGEYPTHPSAWRGGARPMYLPDAEPSPVRSEP